MVTYQIVPSSPKGNNFSNKVSFLVENRHRFNKREYILDIFTCSTKPVYLINNKEVLGKDIIKVTADTAFEIDTLFENPIVAIPKDYKSITFPKEEIETLSKQDKIITTRIMVEKDKYQMGEIVITPWNELFVVSKKVQYKRLVDHPFINELTESQKKEIGNNFFSILYLDKVVEGKRFLSGKDFYIYGVAFKTLNNDELPLNDISGKKECSVLLAKLSDSGDIPIYNPIDMFKLSEGMIENYTIPKQAIDTTVGRYLLNYILLVKSFNKLFPYQNNVINAGKIDDMVATAILNKLVSRKEYDTYMAYGFYIGQFSEFCVPGLSKKALVTDPKIKSLREQLLKENKDKLNDPTVLTKIEAQLVEVDKAWIKGDSSEIFYNVTAGKSYGEHRKKMFLTMGLMQAFEKNATTYSFIPNSLSEGWDPNYLPEIANEIRRGSYDRGKNTAKGGVQTKDILRIFHNLRIIEEDCKVTKGIPLTLTEGLYKLFLKRYILINGKNVLLTTDNYTEYLNKQIMIRSPQYCKTQGGLCHICAGDYFKELDSTAIGMLALEIGSKFTAIAMKSMHFSGIKSTTINNLSPFFF